MKTLTFWRWCGGLAVLAGCAESAIVSDDPVTDDIESGDTGTMDASFDPSTADDDAETARDASIRRDGAISDAGDAGNRDAGARLDASTDASRDAAVDASARDAGTDAGTDSGSGDAGTFNVPNGCARMTLGAHRYAFCTDKRSWSDARNQCLNAGLDLIIINDQPEDDFARVNGVSWIAVNDQTTEGTYVQVVPGNGNRVDGAPATFTRWGTGEPNNSTDCSGLSLNGLCLGIATDEDCTLLNTDGSWNDAKCGNSNVYVCESY